MTSDLDTNMNKKKSSKNNKIYTLKITMLSHPFFGTVEKNTFRTLEIEGNTSLYDLANEIVTSFDFDFDHCFGFYSNRNLYKSDEIYELFTDLPDCEPNENAEGVYKPTISKVFTLGKKMIFLFDYGDNWHFLITCKDISDPVQYPRIIKQNGKTPEQYPPCE